MKTSLEGATLHVADVERSLEFYKRIPGATVEIHRPGRFALMTIDKCRLGLLGMGAAGQFHLEVSTSDLDGLYEQLRQEGIEPGDLPRITARMTVRSCSKTRTATGSSSTPIYRGHDVALSQAIEFVPGEQGGHSRERSQ